MYNCQAFLLNVATHDPSHPLAADDHLPPVLALAAVFAAAGLVYLLYRSRVRWVRADGINWSPGFATAEMPPAELGARPVGGRLRAGQVVAGAVAYLLFVAALVRELCR